MSRTFLHDPAQHDLLTRLRAIAADQPRAPRAPLPIQQRVSTASHEHVVRALRDRNQRLNQENKQLRDELAIALGQLRDLKRHGHDRSPSGS